MLDLKTLVDVRRVLTDYLTAFHTDKGFEELLDIVKKVNSAIIETRKNEETSNDSKEIYSNNMDGLCTDNYNLFTKDKNNNTHIYRADSLQTLLATLEENREMFEQNYKNFVVKSKDGKETKFFEYSISSLIYDIETYIKGFTQQGD